MPVCVTQALVLDETPPIDSEKDLGEAKRELRRKSIKIYELEEKCEMKDNQIKKSSNITWKTEQNEIYNN